MLRVYLFWSKAEEIKYFRNTYLLLEMTIQSP